MRYLEPVTDLPVRKVNLSSIHQFKSHRQVISLITKGLFFPLKRKNGLVNPGLLLQDILARENGIGRVTLNRQVITCGMEAEELKRASIYQNRNRRQGWYSPFSLSRFACKPMPEGPAKSFTDWIWPHVRVHPFFWWRMSLMILLPHWWARQQGTQRLISRCGTLIHECR